MLTSKGGHIILLKNIWKTGKRILLFFGGTAFGAAAWYTIREYRPKPVEPLAPPAGKRSLSTADTFRLLSWNIGFGGFDKSMDFFMDGGKMVRPRSKKQVMKNLKGIKKVLSNQSCDVFFLQETDLDSSRSYHINQQDYFQRKLNLPGIFAWNYKCDFIPYPFPPLGKMSSGLSIFTDLKASSARRLSLPDSFSWPVKTCNLKRCLLEIRIPLKDSPRELVLLNFHLEAYDKGQGKLAQSRFLSSTLSQEYAKGSYVIAGGDFNQILKGEDKYPLHNKNNWTPGRLEKDLLPPHFSLAADDTFPTCRLLDRPYSGSFDKAQVYVLDGFLVSDNLQIRKVSVLNTNFEYTDHQPVLLEVEFL